MTTDLADVHASVSFQGVEEVNGELMEEEEEGKKGAEEEDSREPESALENGAAEEDVEMEAGKEEEEEEEEKKEEVPKDMVCSNFIDSTKLSERMETRNKNT